MSGSPLPAARPVVVFAGDCGICTTLASFAARRVRPQAAIEPWQRLDLATLGLTADQCTAALQFVGADGRIWSGELAVSQLLRAGGIGWRPLGWIIAAPGIRTVAGVAYRWVARNRHRLPGGTAACAYTPAAP